MHRALLSVADKRGIAKLATALDAAGVEIVSTGGTAAVLADAGIATTPVEAVTNQKELLGGRVKTLHPHVHAGILASRSEPAHMRELGDLDLDPFDMVVVNLYPFDHTIADAETTLADAIEQIDIGGPAMLRAAAKNFHHCIPIVNPADHDRLIEHITNETLPSERERLALSAAAFRHTAAYDALIADYLARMAGDDDADSIVLALDRLRPLAYGENPHQSAALYGVRTAAANLPGPTIPGATQLAGADLSYNNIADADAALALVAGRAAPTVAAIKHATPCGVATASGVHDAWTLARDADPVSVYGGVIASNREIDALTATSMSATFLEVVIAPSFTPEAVGILSERERLRLLATGPTETTDIAPAQMLTPVAGGMLVQDADTTTITRDDLTVVTKLAPTELELDDMLLAWHVVRQVRSNAIVLVRDGVTTGIGGGQTNRVDAARHAIDRAGASATGSVLASDGFFPMADSIEAAAAAGITAIIQPGGSRRDDDVIRAANDAGIAMVTTGIRSFRH